MSNYKIDWDKYPNLSWECPNCGNSEDLDFTLNELLENYLLSELEELILAKDSFAINQYCEVCNHTYWIEGKAKKDLDKLVLDYLKD